MSRRRAAHRRLTALRPAKMRRPLLWPRCSLGRLVAMRTSTPSLVQPERQN
jgi:hypothetical protein